VSNPLAPAWLSVPEDLSALDRRIWPQDTVRGPDGQITIGGVPTQELIETFGSPLYVVNLDDLSARAARVREVLTSAIARPGRRVSVYYATKALLTSDVVRSVANQGLGFDVSTAGEMQWTLRSGVQPSSLEFQGNNKSDPELRAALESGVGAIVIDSEAEAHRLVSIAAQSRQVHDVLIRVNSGVHASTHDYLATAREDQKFGIAREDVEGVASVVASCAALRLVGVHSHIGSQIVSPDGFVEATKRLLQVYDQLSEAHPMHTLNLGGGFAIPYTPADPDDNVHAIAVAIAGEIDDFESRTGRRVSEVAFEPGRIIAGPAGVTLYTVGVIKPVEVSKDHSSSSRLYVSVDGGMSDNLRPALYGADYSAVVANRSSSAAPVLARVVGKHCESGDIVVKDSYLPADVAFGDTLAVAATGAYCHSLANNYNAMGRPALVVVESGEARLALAAETLDDVMARDRGLSWQPELSVREGDR
jgi:diaminopimelate decarboxylase